MEHIPTVSLATTAAFILLSIPMSVSVGLRRAKTGILLLHGDDEPLLRLMRAHGNFIEYVPLALLGLAGAEVAGAPLWLLAGCGVALIFARIVHFLGLRSAADSVGRGIGAGLTSLTMLVLGIAILWQLGTSL